MIPKCTGDEGQEGDRPASRLGLRPSPDEFPASCKRRQWPAIALLGAGNGTVTLLRAVLLGTLYGLERYGAIASAVSTLVTLARAAGPLAAALLVQATGSYPLTLAAAALCAAAAAVLSHAGLSSTDRSHA